MDEHEKLQAAFAALKTALEEIEAKDQSYNPVTTLQGWTISNTKPGPFAKIARAALDKARTETAQHMPHDAEPEVNEIGT